jgi:hypothetical protein
MSDSIPPPLRSARGCCGNRFPSFLAGLVVGAAAVGVAATIHIRHEQARLLEPQAIRQSGQAVQDFVGGIGDLLASNSPSPSPSDTDKVRKAGDDSVDDLRQGRLLAVYNLTTAEYRNRVKREDFDKMLAEVANLRLIFPSAQMRESKVRKAAEGNAYEYYCSSGGNGFNGNVVFSFVFEPGDNGVWRISQLEVNYANK